MYLIHIMHTLDRGPNNNYPFTNKGARSKDHNKISFLQQRVS